MVEWREFGSGGKGWVFEASEVLFAATMTDFISFLLLLHRQKF